MNTAAMVDDLATTRIGRTFNQYAGGGRAELLRGRLTAYLAERRAATILLVGEADSLAYRDRHAAPLADRPSVVGVPGGGVQQLPPLPSGPRQLRRLLPPRGVGLVRPRPLHEAHEQVERDQESADEDRPPEGHEDQRREGRECGLASQR